MTVTDRQTEGQNSYINIARQNADARQKLSHYLIFKKNKFIERTDVTYILLAVQLKISRNFWFCLINAYV